MKDLPCWILIKGSNLPIVVHFRNLVVLLHTENGILSTVWVQDEEDLLPKICWVSTGSGKVEGFQADYRWPDGPETRTRFEAQEILPIEPKNVRWMLASMRRAESFRSEALPPWAEYLWKLAKSYVVRAFTYELAGEKVWWGARMIVGFKRTAAGMDALAKLDSAIQSETSGFSTNKAGELDIRLTLASGGKWLESLRISQCAEYILVITVDFDLAAAEWFEKEILPALEMIYVVR